MVQNPEFGDIVCVVTLDRQGQLRKCRAEVTRTCDPADPMLMIGVFIDLGTESVPENVTYASPDSGEHPTWHWPN
jgi:hypothetical protein